MKFVLQFQFSYHFSLYSVQFEMKENFVLAVIQIQKQGKTMSSYEPIWLYTLFPSVSLWISMYLKIFASEFWHR